MANPKVSIVFTSYNHKEFLCQALDSLLAQTFKDFELIIIDDCSTDGSQEILSEYAKKDSRIQLILNSTNSGSYVYSTNQGAALATAPYVIFAQCDDWAEQRQLEVLYSTIVKEDVGVVFCKSNMVDTRGEVLGSDFDVREKRFKREYNNGGRIPKELAFRFLVESCMIPNLSAALIKKDIYDKIGGLSTEYLVMADWDFWFSVSQYSDFYYIATALNNFRQHNNTIRSRIKLSRQVKEHFNLYHRALILNPKLKFRIKQKAAVSWLLSSSQGFATWRSTFKELWCEGCKFSKGWPLFFVFGLFETSTLYIKHLFKKSFKCKVS